MRSTPTCSGLGKGFGAGLFGNKLYVADKDRHILWSINASTGSKEIVAGVNGSLGFRDGSLLTSKFDTPTDIEVDRDASIPIVYGGVAPKSQSCHRILSITCGLRLTSTMSFFFFFFFS